MKVTLVHRTDGAEALTAYMARVSNPSNRHNNETAPKLIRYLIEHGHWSPFEMCSMCVKIETERDIAAQLLRHRSFSFQEFSTRYARTSIAEIPHFRRQDTKNRQNSFDDYSSEDQAQLGRDAGELITKAYGLYYAMVENGVARETARRILPLCTPTVLYMHGTLRSWIHYIHVRTDPGTQLEHREIAEQCKQVFCHEFPVIGEAAFGAGDQ
jgi:thymidylate synthase (FAD)